MNIELKDKNGITLKTAGKYCSEDVGIIPKLQSKSVTANGSIVADEGYCGLNSVTVDVPAQKGEEAGTATITTNGTQTFSPTSGKVFSDFTVTTNVPTGVDTSDATASYRDILAGKTAYAKGSKITGSIETYDGGYFSYVPAQTKFILKNKLTKPASRIFVELASYTTSGVYFNTKNSEGTTRSIDSIDIDSSTLTFNGYASSLGESSVVYTWISFTDTYSGKTYEPDSWIASTAKNLSVGYSDMAISIDGYNWLKQNADDIQYPVSTTLSYVSKVSGDYASTKNAQVFKFSASSGYVLPDTVKVIGAKSVWDKSTGNLTLSEPTGKVTIQITGKAV